MEPAVDVLPPTGPVRAVVLVLHGGRVRGYGGVPRYRLAYLRMGPFARAAHGLGGVAVWRLRYRYRGWNEPHRHPVADARWALARIAREHPGVPVVLVGHSMGGRTALYVATEPNVVAVCALAPWLEPGDPVRLGGRTVLIAHGDRDRTTDPAASHAYALRTGAGFVRVVGDGHAMLRRAALWTRLVRDFTAGAIGVEPPRVDHANHR
ncbi:alpha/beta hydrolase [Saccharothrix violaceirubra]|uniref:Alpha-beta hydrolase superfamily lysophospholipase n=1 Tax=Saccharothrix violaceirubra TaxID=413306 RepID=A0A7W7WVA1_9PSEU|nr:alpha/beta fold hydrolase [Saccharothrix violaceirubra]MBB4964712.1 alpha-beta hydrolase superfamily lysophospholipase [Saccharothrix violaceirubra]